jgi:ATP-dependent Clp protease protease subunit
MLHEKEQLAAEQSARRIEMERTKFDMEERTQKLAEAELARKEAMDSALSDLKSEAERLKAEQEIATARAAADIQALKFDEAEKKAQLMALSAEIAVKEKAREASYYSDQEPQQLDNPLRGNRLVISDRRIELNGPIGSETAEHLATRINFYNNKDSKKPIFIVIDNSPGGSVMSGYKILRAMEGSEAPIWVVVKQYAASMAATIATLADHSAAYPNAIILHHQLSGGISGNLTEQREGLKNIEEWWKRLAEPIAKKMGITNEQFIERMYKEVSSGDWMEFADDAQQLKWIDHVVDEIHETALVKSPDARRAAPTQPGAVPVRRTIAGSVSETAIPIRATGMNLYEQIDEEGRPFVRLPRPNPIDCYYLHNPDSYYRFK